MKKNILLITLVAVALIAGTILLSDGLTYLITSLMALAILGAIRMNKSAVMKLTRWAKANPKKAQWVITGLQLFLMILGVISGKNLNELGYVFSATSAYIFSGLMIIGFLSIPLWSKPNTIAIPKEVDRRRLIYLGISLSSLILSVQIGNRIGDLFPNSPLTHAIDKIDQSIFSDKIINYLGYNQESPEQFNPVHTSYASAGGLALFGVFVVNPGQGLKTTDQAVLPDNTFPPTTLDKAPATKKEIRQVKKEIRKQYRKTAAAASSAGAIIGIFFLVILVCVGACLFAGGIAAVVNGEMIGLLGIVVGPLVIWGAIKGIKNLSKKNRAPTT